MKSHTAYMTFETAERRELIRITEEVQAAVDEAGIAEGMVLVSAMHITAGVWVNDDEPGLHEDVIEWLDKIAPPSWKPAANAVAVAGSALKSLPPAAAGDRGFKYFAIVCTSLSLINCVLCTTTSFIGRPMTA